MANIHVTSNSMDKLLKILIHIKLQVEMKYKNAFLKNIPSEFALPLTFIFNTSFLKMNLPTGRHFFFLQKVINI